MEFGTKSYTQETPAWLWDAFTQGPADDADRYCDRINALIAVDVLNACPEQLTDVERRQAAELAAGVPFDGR